MKLVRSPPFTHRRRSISKALSDDLQPIHDFRAGLRFRFAFFTFPLPPAPSGRDAARAVAALSLCPLSFSLCAAVPSRKRLGASII